MPNPKIMIAALMAEEDQRMQPSLNYLRAVEENGGTGFMSGRILTEEDADDCYRRFDALVLTGGADINAEFLGEPAHPKAFFASRDRDITEFLLARRFMAGNKPVLAICRGEQVLNAAMGGKHDQHIFDRPEVCIEHQNRETLHPVSLVPGTLLSSLFDGAESITVNSTHHQGVRTLAPVFRLNAMSPDGVIEGYEYGDRVLAVQFHPERLPAEVQDPIFRWLIQSAETK